MPPAGAPGTLAPGEAESDGGDAPASASCCRCATCGPRTSPTLAPCFFHRCRAGVLVAGCCEVPQDEPQSRSEVKRSAWAFMLLVSAALAAGACPPDRPSRWISLTALVSLHAGRRNEEASGQRATSTRRPVRHHSRSPPRRTAPLYASLELYFKI